MAKKYGPNDEWGIEKEIKFKKDEISNKMSIADIEKRITDSRKEIESSDN
jgi:hypothetical protein